MKELFEKPLILLTTQSPAELISVYGFEPEDEIEPLCGQTSDVTQLLKALCQNPDMHEHAVTLLCSMLRPRVRIWWAYQCLEMTIDKVKAKELDVELKGVPPEPGAEAMKEIDQLAELDEKDVLPPPVMVDGVNLSDEASYPEPHVNDKGELIFLPEPLQNSPYRAKTLLEERIYQRENSLKRLPKPLADAVLAIRKKKEDKFVAAYGLTPDKFWANVLEEQNRIKGVDAPEPELPLKAKLTERFDRAKEIMNDQMGIVDKEIAKMKANLPKVKVSASLSSDRVEQLMVLVMNWIVEPTTENGLRAFDLAQKCKGNETAAQLLGYATYWSCPDIAPIGSPVPVPPSPALSPKGVFGALTSARTSLVPDVMPDEFLEDFITIGIEVAQGINLWDERLAVDKVDDPWRGKAGFGRKLAQPNDLDEVELSSEELKKRNEESSKDETNQTGFRKRKTRFGDHDIP